MKKVDTEKLKNTRAKAEKLNKHWRKILDTKPSDLEFDAVVRDALKTNKKLLRITKSWI